MIQMAQDFMDILRKKKDEDFFTGEEDITDFQRDIEQDTDEGTTDTMMGRLDRDTRQGMSGAEAADKLDAKRRKKLQEKAVSARNLQMWERILETFSKNPDITANEIRDAVKEFSKSFLIPRNRSKDRINRFYQSIVTKEADPKLLNLFFTKPKDTGIQISGDVEALGIDLSDVEREYNGQESLDILREFFEAIADMPRDLLAGKKMTRSKLDRLEAMLINTARIDTDNLPEDPKQILKLFREIVLTLDRYKENEESRLSKSADPSQAPIPDFIRRKVEEEVEEKTKDIEDEDKKEEAKEEMSKKLFRDYRAGKFPESSPERRAAARRIFESLGTVRGQKGKTIQEQEKDLPDVFYDGKGEKKVQSTIDSKDRNWEMKVEPGEFSYQTETEVFDTNPSVLGSVEVLLDNLENMMEDITQRKTNSTDTDEVDSLDKLLKQMKSLIKVTIGDYKFKLSDDETRAIKIN